MTLAAAVAAGRAGVVVAAADGSVRDTFEVVVEAGNIILTAKVRDFLEANNSGAGPIHPDFNTFDGCPYSAIAFNNSYSTDYRITGLRISRNYIRDGGSLPITVAGPIAGILIDQNYIDCWADLGKKFDAASLEGLSVSPKNRSASAR